MISVRLGFYVLALLVGLAGSAHAQPATCDDVDELNSVYFAFTTERLIDESDERLGENLVILQRCPDLGVLVEGYADDEEAMADALSALRAETAAAWYLARGVDADRIAARGLGEDRNSSSFEDPGPGDIRARRADSMPMPLGELPADAMAWADAERTDPEPIEQGLAEGVTLTLDWDLADETTDAGDACPARPAEASALTLGAATLTVDGRRTSLDVACLRTAWPGSGLLDAATALVADGVVLVRGTLSPNGAAEAVVWLAGPDGSRRLESDPCPASEAYAAALALDLDALVEAERVGDAEAVRRAAAAALANGAPLVRLAVGVAEVGGPPGTRRLDCRTVLPHYDH